ncbi:F-box/LRR-repeat protein 16-like [Mercenaria mercenaria]|uniref:F-box/LRR-repeat protein 16-like n=1 Tax=Mercenaria mercenaria TaxID=6596 RepID=UPI00234F3568|nr:F-box/LRR-repeat protein 16-like [Mercenaria mercenaria]
MSTIRKAYMEISNGIRGLRLHREQPQPAQTATSKEIVSKQTTNGSTVSSAQGHRMVRSPKPLIARKIRSLFGRTQPTSVRDLFLDERFLAKFFMFFSAEERGKLSQVCKAWKNILYQPKFWINVIPIIACRDLSKRDETRRAFYESLQQRSFDAVCLFGATDEDIADFVNHFSNCKKQIRSISLRCSNVTDSGLEILFKRLSGIYRLEISGCNELTETGLWSCLNPKIVSLSVSDCINVADDTVGAVSQLLPSLYEFNLQAYHVTDAALAFFSAKQSYTLCILRLQSCWEITNHGVVNIVHSLPNLTILSLSGCSKITDDGVELIAENLRKLRVLDLSWCPRVTDAALEYIACDLNQLEELILDRCSHVTDIGVGYLSTMTSLLKLFLRWCTQIRDFGLQHMYSMRSLRVLSLAGCSLISGQGLCGLTQLRCLEELELTNCPSATKEVCLYLKENMPRCMILE